MKCLVTGASGFIGRRLCHCLKEQGWEVLALSRQGGRLADGMPISALDLTAAMPGAELRGVDAVFHLAGIAHQDAPAQSHEALNHEATLKLAAAASAAGVQRFVFVSSVKAMGAGGERSRAEDDVREPESAYGLSKWRAECSLRAHCADGGMSVAIVRPALVFGAGVKGNLQWLARCVRPGFPRPPGLGRRSMIGVDDLVEVLRLAAVTPWRGERTWIASGESLSTREVFDALCRVKRGRVAADWLPLWAWRVAARARDLLTGLPAGSTFDKLFGTELYDSARLIAATGWLPRQSFELAAEQMLESSA